jgi:hypothetical protein
MGWTTVVRFPACVGRFMITNFKSYLHSYYTGMLSITLHFITDMCSYYVFRLVNSHFQINYENAYLISKCNKHNAL